MKALPLLAAALVIAAPAVAAPEKAPAKKHKPAEAKGENDVPLDREHVHMVKPGETLGASLTAPRCRAS